LWPGTAGKTALEIVGKENTWTRGGRVSAKKKDYEKKYRKKMKV